jgi:diketogulonate reductase-like aldo/keto reductase
MQTVHAGNAAIPAIGFGTYGMSGDDIYRTVPAALRAGFRHIDTAQSTVTRPRSATASPHPASREAKYF